MAEMWRNYLKNNEVTLGAGVIFILALIIVPLPGVILDGLIAISLMTGLLILLTALSAKSPAEFTVFPTILLVTTIYRLAVNISSTRMILSHGPTSDSALINAFGTFVVGGGGGMSSYLIGVIIFLILTLVQIMVITKGATRVSEVAARFSLDAMPGRQLAIDTDLAAGHIDEKEARKRREALQKEMAFYGAMDGASKFVQGDVRVGLIITAINILGGLLVGMWMRNEGFMEALETYTKFTIGDGLVAQLPALLVSTAAGIVVTRSVGDNSLPADMKAQMLSNPRMLYVAGGTMAASGLIPGFPLLAMGGIGGLMIYLGTVMEKSLKEEKEREKEKETEKIEDKKPENYLQHLKTEPLIIEIGFNLVPLVDPKSGGTLLDQISRLRRQFASSSGLIVPPVRIRDNMALEDGGEYVIRLHGTIIGQYKLEPDKLLAIASRSDALPLSGAIETIDPSFGVKGYWISPESKGSAEADGYNVVDASTVITTHLSQIILENSSEIMGRQEIKAIIDSIRQDNPVIVDEVLTEKKVTLGQIQSILQGLLREGVSIRNMVRILEAISNNAERTGRDPFLLTEAVRQVLHRQITDDYLDSDKTLHCLTIDPQIEKRLREAVHRDPEEGFVIALKPELQIAIRDSLKSEYEKEFEKARAENRRVVFLTSRAIRAPIYYLMERIARANTFAVLATEEIPPYVHLDVHGMVSMRQRSEEEAVA